MIWHLQVDLIFTYQSLLKFQVELHHDLYCINCVRRVADFTRSRVDISKVSHVARRSWPSCCSVIYSIWIVVSSSRQTVVCSNIDYQKYLEFREDKAQLTMTLTCQLYLVIFLMVNGGNSPWPLPQEFPPNRAMVKMKIL